MIYQCFFKSEQEGLLFKSDLYRPFGLEPTINPDLLKNCPELEDPLLRTNLSEYSAFLHIYRNDVLLWDSDWWIGFTSYRQLDKSPVVFSNRSTFERLIHSIPGGFCGWGFYLSRTNASIQSETCHPGINEFLMETLASQGELVPARFFTDRLILFANYWVMEKPLFLDFMDWSWPLVVNAISKKNHVYTRFDSQIATVTNSKWLGYFIERLFIIWYMKKNLSPVNFGPVCGLQP